MKRQSRNAPWDQQDRGMASETIRASTITTKQESWVQKLGRLVKKSTSKAGMSFGISDIHFYMASYDHQETRLGRRLGRLVKKSTSKAGMSFGISDIHFCMAPYDHQETSLGRRLGRLVKKSTSKAGMSFGISDIHFYIASYDHQETGRAWCGEVEDSAPTA